MLKKIQIEYSYTLLHINILERLVPLLKTLSVAIQQVLNSLKYFNQFIFFYTIYKFAMWFAEGLAEVQPHMYMLLYLFASLENPVSLT